MTVDPKIEFERSAAELVREAEKNLEAAQLALRFAREVHLAALRGLQRGRR